jgi:hypothetical protein
MIRHMRTRQSGMFAAKRDVWSAFTATEHFSTEPRAFLWEARIAVAPLVAVHVRDTYSHGVGVMHGELAAVLTVVDQRGTREMASASLHRYLAEAPWFPTALLPAEGVRWEPVDDRTAIASITDCGVTVRMEVHFGPRGEIVRVRADRYRDVDGKAVLTPWQGSFDDYERVAGMMVPTRSEVGWLLPEGWYPYWRGVNERIEYELASPDEDEPALSPAHETITAPAAGRSDRGG